jgi:hypothetical protein
MSKVLVSKRVIKVKNATDAYCIYYDIDYFTSRPMTAKIYSIKFYYVLKLYEIVYNILCKLRGSIS